MTDVSPAAAPTVSALRRDASAELARAGVPEPEVDADLLLGHVLGVGRGRVHALAVTDGPVEAADARRFSGLVARRARREPLQHITGLAPFRSLELCVGPGVFVPRPETEIVAQLAIDSLRAVAAPEPIAVDLGTGSGALALAVAVEVPHARVFGVENSPEAFVWTRQNFERIAPENATAVFDDLARALRRLDERVDLVVSNPPYIPENAVPRDPEVRLFDPAHALYGGPDGLDVVRVLSGAARRLLRPGGTLVIEHGELQGAEIRGLLTADGWRAVATHRDLTTRDRATTAVR